MDLPCKTQRNLPNLLSRLLEFVIDTSRRR